MDGEVRDVAGVGAPPAAYAWNGVLGVPVEDVGQRQGRVLVGRSWVVSHIAMAQLVSCADLCGRQIVSMKASVLGSRQWTCESEGKPDAEDEGEHGLGHRM